MTPEVIRKLESAFVAGCTDLEACCYADISKTALYEYCQKNDAFAERKETLKNQPVMQARFIIQEALTTGDLNTANRVVDRKDGQKINQVTVEMSHEQWLDTLE
ncbi:MAG: hypothetical protein ABUK13_07695 [Gammaproteobacteria bacterium]